ncbi:MAG: amino acid adenylation domain-containing protein [Cyanobacteriota bacterium]|nr:amino acid adenylation domain-containing protein [Cyanobacteriota bacterium]
MSQDRENYKFLREWNKTAVDYPPDICLHQLFEAQVERTPNSVAVVFEGNQLTYEGLNQKANQLAHYLQNLGIGPNVLVGICLERSLEMVISLLGILKAGGAYIPFDPGYPQERLAYMLSDSQVSVVLTSKTSAPALPDNYARLIYWDSDWSKFAQKSQKNPLSTVNSENLAYTLYTSGSTGKPKGAMNSHRGIVNRLLWMQDTYQLTSSDRVLQKTPFSFDVSIWEFFWPLLAGARLIVARPDGHKDTAYLVRLITQESITTLHFVPSMLQIFLEEPTLEQCNSIKRVICSGEVLPVATKQRFFARLEAELHNLYGPTEAAIDVTFWKCQPEGNRTSVPIGRPIANTQIYILDSELQPVPIGESGEIHIGGVGVGMGYLNRPELTAQKFIDNPFSDRPGNRLYKTGDLGRYLPDGNIEYIGRLDHQVKLRGLRIELGEIEAALAQHPNLRQVAVIVREHQTGVNEVRTQNSEVRSDFGNGDLSNSPKRFRQSRQGFRPNYLDKRLVAYVCPQKGKVLTSVELRHFLKQKLPDYMVPGSFVMLEALPLTPSGKLNRRALPVLGTSNLVQETSFVAPRDAMEQQLAQIWSEVLGISPIGIHDNFIELGGHSLLATKIIGLVRARLQAGLPLNHLFEFPTVAELAKEVFPLEGLDVGLSLQPISREQTIPLSFAQEQLWFLNQLTPEEPVYNESLTIHLGGEIDIPALEIDAGTRGHGDAERLIFMDDGEFFFIRTALEKSLTELIRRHEILRTTYPLVNGQPCQEIQPPSTFTLPIVDLRQWSETAREREALRIATEQLRQRFDLNKGPLLRATLIQLTSDSYRLYFAIHHILIDGESFIKIVQELEIIYTAFSQGLPSPLPELTIQYADFAVWQRQRLQEEALSNQLAYWQKRLENLPQLKLPTDRPRTPQTTFTGSRLCFTLSKDLTEKLRAISRKEDVTLFITLATVIKVLLYRYSSQEDIVIGTVTSQRNRQELQGIIGDFLNTLVLHSDLSGNPSFLELLKRVRNVILSAYANQDVPFEQVVNALHCDRHISQNPLFQVMFVLQPPLNDDRLGWKVSQLEVDSGCSKFDLTFNLEERPEGMIGAIEYNTDLFDAATIDRVLGHLITLLEGIVAHPETSIAQLPLLTEAESHQLLVEWNDTAVNYPQDKCIHQLFEEQVEKTPDAVAVVFEGQELTYQELNCRGNQLAHYLQTLGVGPEVLVGICVERSLEMMVGLLGILKTGGAYVPIDPGYPTERIAYMLEDSAVSVLLTSKSLRLGLPEHSARVVCLDSDWDTIVSYSIKNIDSGVTPENLAYVIYTSGSTGKPKGTMIIHTGVVNYLSWCIQVCQLTPGNGVPVNSSIGFDLTISSLFSPLFRGQKVILLPEQDEIEALSQLLCSQKNLSLVKITPAHLQILNTLIPPEKAPNQTKALIIAGEALPVKTVSFWSNNAPETKLINEYGPTETVVGCCAYEVKPEESDREIVPIGRPIANTKIYILDSNNQPVPIGVPGELHIGGAGLARGYLNRPELTEQKFIPNPFDKSKVKSGGTPRRRKTQAVRPRVGEKRKRSEPASAKNASGRNPRRRKTQGNADQERERRPREGTLTKRGNAHQESQKSKLYKTGDLARYLPDGNIEFLGRIDNQVKIRGFRIELGEIEALLAQHSNVQEAVVIAREDIPGDKRLVAYLIINDAKTTIDDLRSFLKSKLPEYMIPAAFVFLETMPLTPNGKVNRRALPIPDASSLLRETSFFAPRDSLELQLAQIWSEILGVYAIGVRDNFFDLGGHSLLAVRLMAEIEKQFGKNLSLAVLFQGATVEQLAILLRQKTDTHSWSPLVAIQPQGNHPPFFCMPGSGGNVVYFHQLARYFGNDRPFYALQPPSLDGVSEPFGSVEEVAAYYIQAIQSLQPSGPYFLGGHSFGVLVAFEMAQQLQQKGETVALLALFDLPARVPGRAPKQLDWDDTRWLTNIAHILEILSGKNLNISYETLKLLTPEAQLTYLKQQMETFNLLPPNSGIERVRGIVQTIKADELAFMSYVPQGGYQSPITLFRTSEVYQDVLGMLDEIPTDPTWGWNQFSTQPVEVHVVPGNHTTMLSEPHVQVLAGLLKLCYQQSSSDFQL